MLEHLAQFIVISGLIHSEAHSQILSRTLMKMSTQTKCQWIKLNRNMARTLTAWSGHERASVRTHYAHSKQVILFVRFESISLFSSEPSECICMKTMHWNCRDDMKCNKRGVFGKHTHSHINRPFLIRRPLRIVLSFSIRFSVWKVKRFFLRTSNYKTVQTLQLRSRDHQT